MSREINPAPPAKWNYRARPESGYPCGAAQLDPAGAELQCDAMWFPDADQARAWAKFRGWKRYVLKAAVGV